MEKRIQPHAAKFRKLTTSMTCSRGENFFLRKEQMKFSPRRPRWKYSKRKIIPVIAVIQKKASSSSSRSASSKESLRPASPSVKPMPSATLKPPVKQKTRSTIDYKNVSLLRKCITGEGKIFPRRLTRVTSKQQRYIENAIKKARILGLLPFINISRPSRF